MLQQKRGILWAGKIVARSPLENTRNSALQTISQKRRAPKLSMRASGVIYSQRMASAITTYPVVVQHESFTVLVPPIVHVPRVCHEPPFIC